MTKSLIDTNKDCRYFDGCSAPLCPRDKGAAGCTWFPDEDICRLVDVPDWVKRQRKIFRKAARVFYPCHARTGLPHFQGGVKGIETLMELTRNGLPVNRRGLRPTRLSQRKNGKETAQSWQKTGPSYQGSALLKRNRSRAWMYFPAKKVFRYPHGVYIAIQRRSVIKVYNLL
ncbi:MAG: hypothetical protein LBR10_06165 [Prevotellaceae bacterium]|jgi:hypothetical protein|nr:hypothetical protein [Prevotellaceae bacterium]